MRYFKIITLCLLLFAVFSSALTADELQNAIKLGEISKVIKLIENDPSLAQVKDKTGCTPLLLAVYMGRNEIASLLVSTGVSLQDKDATGETPLHIAAVMDNKEIAELLVSKGANKYAKDDAGLTPLDIAREMKHADLEQILSNKNIITVEKKTYETKIVRQQELSSRGSAQPARVKKQVSKPKTSKKIKRIKK